jgi:hypothetical protein
MLMLNVSNFFIYAREGKMMEWYDDVIRGNYNILIRNINNIFFFFFFFRKVLL